MSNLYKIGNHHNLSSRIKEVEQQLQKLSERVTLQGDSDLFLSQSIKQQKFELEFFYECENSLWEQRAKVKWNTQGERNTKYCHSIVNRRNNYNLICCLQLEDGSWENDQSKLQSCSMDFYGNLYTEVSPFHHQDILMALNKFHVPQMEDEDTTYLMKPISILELKAAVFSLPPNSAPG